MKHIFILCAVVALMISCGEAEKPAASDTVVEGPGDTPMSETLVPAVDEATMRIDSVAEDTTSAAAKYRVTLTVYYTTSYCGGARPSQDIVAGHEAPRLFASSSLRLKNHHTGKEYWIKTSSGGTANYEFEEGKYDVFLTEDIRPSLNTGFDPDCAIWKQQLLVTVKIGPNSKAQDVNIHFVCNPCDDDMKIRQ